MVRVADVLWLVWQTLHFRMADGLWSGWLMFMVRMANSSWPEWLTFHGQDVKLLMVRMANSSQTRWLMLHCRMVQIQVLPQFPLAVLPSSVLTHAFSVPLPLLSSVSKRKPQRTVRLCLRLGNSNTGTDCTSKKWQSFKILYSVKKRQGK